MCDDDLFPCVIFKKEIHGCLLSKGHLFILIFFSLVLLFCAVLLVTVLFLFQKVAINNTLISKECL